MLFDKPEKARWPRSHHFTLSERGRSAELAYRTRIEASRKDAGRAAFDAARSAWAEEHRLQADDALYLSELVRGGVTLPQLVEALESCGQTKKAAVAALGRLQDAGMFDDRIG